VKRRELDVHALPDLAFGHRSPLWWSLILLCAIEGTMLVLLVLSYFYVRDRTSPWPPTLGLRPAAWIMTMELALMIASCLPMIASSQAAKRGDVRGMRRTLIVGTALAVAAGVCRWQVFAHLPFHWDSHAYGSVVWTLLGVQLTHGLSGILENAVFIALLFIGPVEEKHRVDVSVSTVLWWFVVAGTFLVWAVVFAPALFGEG
jgi:cytochrome c oxidase subunit 3